MSCLELSEFLKYWWKKRNRVIGFVLSTNERIFLEKLTFFFVDFYLLRLSEN